MSRRLLRRLGVLPVFAAAMVALAAGAAPASAVAAPPPVPAALGPGTLAPPSSIPATAAQSCAVAAAKAGFSYNRTVAGYPQMVVAVAVALAESSCNPSAVYTNSNGCKDRGLWQIDNCAHPNVSDTCAYQSQCNADAAFTISSRGASWTPWSTYNSGAWRSYISTAQSAVSGFTVQLENQADGTCLDADSSSRGNGGKIFQWTCNGSDSYQKWQIINDAPNNPLLKNVGTGTCLDADGTSSGNGAPIFQWSCNTNDTYQRWWFVGSGDLNTNGHADAGVHSAGDGTCLDADGAKKGNGAPIFQWTCNSSDHSQQWN